MKGSTPMLNSSSIASVSIRTAALGTLLALTFGQAAQAAVTLRPLAAQAARTTALRPSAVVTFTTIDDPTDKTFNQLLGINDDGVISGYYGLGSKGHPNKGYTIAPPYNTFVSDNLPTSTQTQATGIIDGGTTSGFWSPTNVGNGGDANFGFIRMVNNGVTLYLSVSDPLATSSPAVNQVLGVNTSGNAVGFYNDKNNMPHGFVYSVKTGNFTALNIPNAVSDAVTGINSNNVVSGFFTDTKGHTKGFVESLINGKNVHYLVPGSTFTQFLGVNSGGFAVGFYMGSDNFPHGVLYNSNNGALTIVNDPQGAQGTTLNGINDKGQVVGFYTDAKGNTHGMLVNGL
jgi:hypothetical protein